MNKKIIGILDYGVGNLKSVSNAVEYLGFDVRVVAHGVTSDLSHLIVPGVGAFDAAMAEINQRSLVSEILEFATSGRPMLGICVGMQVLAEFGEEGCGAKGLGLIPGIVTRFNTELAVPHCGWNSVELIGRHPVTEGFKRVLDFYFVHSYCFKAPSGEYSLGNTDYGGSFCAISHHKNVVGVQFHAEKSQGNGLRLIENFCNWDGRC